MDLQEQEVLSIDARENKGVRSTPKYENNPFLSGVIIKTRSKKLTVARGGHIVNSETGELEGVTEIAQIVNVEKEQFIKIFTKDISLWFDLNRTALRVFGALLYIYQDDSIRNDLVYFHHEDDRIKHFNIKKASWFTGLEELLRKGFLARHIRTNWFYINPSMFFNGDRARFIREYRIKDENIVQENIRIKD
jgi:hypothetical protein